jgi:hypothetical protein
MPLNRENRRRQITLNVTPYVYDVDAVALSLINQFKADGADPEVTRLDDYKLSLTFRESDELTYEVTCQKILWNQYVQNIEQKNVTTNIEVLKKMLDPYFDSPVVASSEVLGDGKGQLDGISPSAFSDGEVLWADGKPMPHPSYTIGDSEVRVPAGGPMPLSRDLEKDAESSTITAAMDKDTFFCGDGVMKVGDEFHQVKDDYRDEDDEERKRGGRHQHRGGAIELPNGHLVSIAWGNINYSDNYKPNLKGDLIETPRTAEVAVITPDDRFIDLDDPKGEHSHVYGYQTTEEAKDIIRRAKEL